MTHDDTNGTDLSDDELLTRLDQASQVIDPPPPDLADIALRALTWDQELGELVQAAESEAVLVRNSRADLVDFSFEVDGHILELSVEPEPGADGYRLSGLLVPEQASVSLIVPGRSVERLSCDSFGRFETVVKRSVAIGFQKPDGSMVRTPLLDLP